MFTAELRKFLQFYHYSELALHAGAWNMDEILPSKISPPLHIVLQHRAKVGIAEPCSLSPFCFSGVLYVTQRTGRHGSRIYL